MRGLKPMNRRLQTLLLFVLILVCFKPGQAQLPPETAAKIDAAVEKVLADTGTPSASIAVVQNDQIVYVKAYGNSGLDPTAPALPEMRYPIGSVSKQFLAASILLLAEEGRLRLDDPVVGYLPRLTRANNITIRE